MDRAGADRFTVELERLYHSQAPVLAKRLTRRGAASEEALDFVHEAFVRILNRPPAVDRPVERWDAYLSRISRNLVADRARSDSVRARWLEDATVNREHDQIVYLESRDALRRLEPALMKLKPRMREIFLARRLDGLSYAEIAEQTGLTIKAVERQMSKAIAKLSRMMDRPER
jgi:RNA polymerase sigma-70 factor (ECF subfamily)